MATSIIASITTLCGLGIFFGLVLAYAAKKFHVPVDPTIEKILAKLPGANCGSCGKAGCMGFAQALLAGELDLHSCSVAATENKKDIAAILGLSLEEKAKKVSCLHCCGGNHAKDKFLYDGIKDCLAASLVLGGQKECAYGCLTYGTCVKACPFGAIEMTGEGYPRIIESKCTACGICVNVCPKGFTPLFLSNRKKPGFMWRARRTTQGGLSCPFAASAASPAAAARRPVRTARCLLSITWRVLIMASARVVLNASRSVRQKSSR
jgi:Na+-translocating ferredoxin:NAD+ oxidoreductase RNF subunit RnfB